MSDTPVTRGEIVARPHRCWNPSIGLLVNTAGTDKFRGSWVRKVDGVWHPWIDSPKAWAQDGDWEVLAVVAVTS